MTEPSKFRHSGKRRPSRPQPIYQALTCRLPCGIGVDFVVIYVGDVLHDPIVLKTDGILSVVSGHDAGRQGGGVVNERGEGVLTMRMMRSFADDAVWTRGVRKWEPRSSKIQNDARACACNAVKRVSKGTRRTRETIEEIKEMALGVLYSILFPERMGTRRRPKNGPVLPVVTTERMSSTCGRWPVIKLQVQASSSSLGN